jgi:asparaginyl-tRNA synthetase
MRVKEFLKLEESTAGTTVTVKGWVRTLREQGGGRFAFVELNDGSCNAGMQVLLNREPAEGDPATQGFAEAMAAGGTGSSMSFTGMISKSPAKGQLLELHAHSATVLGTTIAKDYPMSKKRHTAEQLRKVAHLRPRAKGHASAMRVRHAMAYATHKFFEENGFYYIHTPLITASDCEGAGEMFQVTTLLEAANKKAEVSTENETSFNRNFMV